MDSQMKPEFNMSRADVAVDVAHELYPIDPAGPLKDPDLYRKFKDVVFSGEDVQVEAEVIVIEHDDNSSEGEV